MSSKLKPGGEYVAQVTGVKKTTTRDGRPAMRMQFTVVGGEQAGTVVEQLLVQPVLPPSKRRERRALARGKRS